MLGGGKGGRREGAQTCRWPRILGRHGRIRSPLRLSHPHSISPSAASPLLRPRGDGGWGGKKNTVSRVGQHLGVGGGGGGDGAALIRHAKVSDWPLRRIVVARVPEIYVYIYINR